MKELSLFSALIEFKNLKSLELDLFGNAICNKGVKSLLFSLIILTHLDYLQVNLWKIEIGNSRIFSLALSKHKKLREKKILFYTFLESS